MDRLAEQVVAWHNRHPLAKRITIYDVHTIGVVALPFMRNAQADAAARHGSGKDKVEPVLTQEISPESLAAAWDDEGLTIAAHPNAAHLDALADQEPPPDQAKPSWAERLGRFAFWRKNSGAQSWPVFSERFVSHLSPRQVAAFAQAHGYSQQPGDETWPQRIIPIDDTLMERGVAGAGAWPFELYLMSAAVDAGRSRSRILLGRGRQPAIVGRRCLSPRRLGLVGLLLLALLGAVLGLTLPAVKKATPAGKAAAAASAPASATALASAAAPAASLGTPELGASGPLLALDTAPAPASSASLPLTAATQAPSASAAGSSPAPSDPEQAEEKPVLRPDIRPSFIKPIPGRNARPLGAPPLEAAPKDAAGSSSPATDTAEESAGGKPDKSRQDSAKTPDPAIEPTKPKLRSALAHASKPKLSSAEPGSSGADPTVSAAKPASAALNGKAIAKAASLASKPVVALVGPVSANKADAEATLARMRAMLGPSQGGSALQAQVFQTPEGWRPAVWPFASREEAQLINATLIARGMRTRAVDF